MERFFISSDISSATKSTFFSQSIYSSNQNSITKKSVKESTDEIRTDRETVRTGRMDERKRALAHYYYSFHS